MSKTKKLAIFFHSVLTLMTLSSSLSAQLVRAEDDYEVVRRESLVSEKIQRQIEDMLSNYYKKGTFIVNVRSEIEKLPVEEPMRENISTEPQEEEINMPGLPAPIPSVRTLEPEPTRARPTLLGEEYKIRYSEILILLDEKNFKDDDERFVTMIARTRANIDEQRGDSLTVRSLPFPPPLEAFVATKDELEEKKPAAPLTEIYPYLIFGSAILGILLFTIIVLQVVNIMKKGSRDLYSGAHNYLPKGHQQGAIPQLTSIKSDMEMPSAGGETSQDRKDIFYELRQLMVATLVGNPALASEIFKKWVGIDKADGIYQLSGFLKATDPRLIDILAEYLGSDITAKAEFAMNQMVSVDKDAIIDIFKKFREEFQKEQSIRAEKTASGEQEDLFRFLKQLTTEQIFHIIKDEPVSIIAIVIAQLEPDIANTVLRDLPEEKQPKIAVEMGKLKKIPITAYRDISDNLAKKALEVEKIKYVTTDGIEALVNMLEQSPPEKEQEILGAINEHDITLSEELRKVYITFDEIPRLPDKALSEILRGFDRNLIIKALIDAKFETKNKILNNLPSRTSIIVNDGLKVLEETNETPIEEIHFARREVMQKIRELARSGKLDLKKLV